MCNCDEIPFDQHLEDVANASYGEYRAKALAAEAEARRRGEPARQSTEATPPAIPFQDTGRTLIGTLAVGVTPVSIRRENAGNLTVFNSGFFTVWIGDENVSPTRGLWIAPGEKFITMVPQLSRTFLVAGNEGAEVKWKLCY
jgi:hypothetical protein